MVIYKEMWTLFFTRDQGSDSRTPVDSYDRMTSKVGVAQSILHHVLAKSVANFLSSIFRPGHMSMWSMPRPMDTCTTPSSLTQNSFSAPPHKIVTPLYAANMDLG